MNSDIVVALGQATVSGSTLFAMNLHGVAAEWPVLRRLPGQDYPAGSVLRLGTVQVPQVRQTSTVVGCGPRQAWGFTHGLNEHQVAIGVAGWSSKLPHDNGGLLGTDLVRLTLQGSRSASQAVETLTDLIRRHGQQAAGTGPGANSDHVFLVADGHEALVVEAAGRYWAVHECQQVRAVSDAALIRQDWQRLAPGLSELASAQGWWAHDGSKLDFSGSLSAPCAAHAWGLKRWGRATLLLEQQNGHIDLWFLRRLLADHYESQVAKMAPAAPGERPALHATFLTALSTGPEALAMAWCAFGLPRRAAYLPVFLDADLPACLQESNIVGQAFQQLPAALAKALQSREELDKWQARVDQQTEDFLVQARMLKREGNLTQLRRQASLFLDSLFERRHETPRSRQATALEQDMAYVLE